MKTVFTDIGRKAFAYYYANTDRYNLDTLRDITYGEFVGPKIEGETQVVRNPVTANGELRQVMHLGINTMWEAFEHNLKVGRNKKDFVMPKATGWRIGKRLTGLYLQHQQRQ